MQLQLSYTCSHCEYCEMRQLLKKNLQLFALCYINKFLWIAIILCFGPGIGLALVVHRNGRDYNERSRNDKTELRRRCQLNPSVYVQRPCAPNLTTINRRDPAFHRKTAFQPHLRTGRATQTRSRRTIIQAVSNVRSKTQPTCIASFQCTARA